jgi:hypothetical protein
MCRMSAHERGLCGKCGACMAIGVRDSDFLYATQIFFSTVFFLQTTQLVQHVLSKSLDVGVGGSFC